MRCRSNLLASVIALLSGVVCVAALAQMPTYKVGRTPSAEEIGAWDTRIGPEGKELPPGSGTAKEGAKVWAQRCTKCHGVDGKYQWPLRAHPPSGGKAPVLAGEEGVIEGRQFATTIWDYINRAMPLGQEAGSLSADEVYAATAYLLHLDGIIKENDVMDAKSLPKVRMPHRPPDR
jgi:S-disulfanyl-L-cysteine oxidoreductase SoxD